MAYLKSLLYELTPELLSFCWKNIKYKYKSTHKFSIKEFHDFYIPSRWFVKVSYLLRVGKLKYSKYLYNQGFIRKELFIFNSTPRDLKSLVLQKALICVLKPSFGKYLQSYNFGLANCLRMAVHK